MRCYEALSRFAAVILFANLFLEVLSPTPVLTITALVGGLVVGVVVADRVVTSLRHVARKRN